MRRTVWCGGLLLLSASMLGAFSAHARAEPQALAVLGLAGDDDESVAAALTDALRYEAQSEGNFRVSDSHVSLSQMTMAHDCDIADSPCRAQIVKALAVEQVIYGELQRKPSGGYDVDLHMFAAEGGETQAHRAIASTESDRISLRMHARALLRELQGIYESDAAAGAQTADGDAAELRGNASTTSDTAPDTAGSNDWLGYTLLGVAGVSLGLTLFSWSQIQAAAHDDDFEAYRKAVGVMKPSIRDVCDEAEAGRSYGVGAARLAKANDVCSRGNAFERLQFVFVGAMLLSAGIGTYFLLDGDGADSDEEAKADQVRFSLRPSVGLHGASLGARIAF